MKLTATQRRRLQYALFALPGRRYPIPDKSHAANARARVMQFGTPAEKKTVFAKTFRFFR